MRGAACPLSDPKNPWSTYFDCHIMLFKDILGYTSLVCASMVPLTLDSHSATLKTLEALILTPKSCFLEISSVVRPSIIRLW